MDPNHTPHSSSGSHTRPEVASELNNLLQIIAGTSATIENVWEGNPDADKYFEMLRTSVARAVEVTKDLVERSESTAGKIVLHPEFERMRKQAEKNTAALPKPRLLVVDDEKMLLTLTGEFLRDAGFEVVTAQSGFECLDLLRQGPIRFDLVLLDLNMPLMDGQETFQRIRALRPDARVMLCTGYVQQDRLRHMLDAGLCGFIQKPLSPQDYVKNVRAVLACASFGNADLPRGFSSAK